jgi:hypothetical protein
MRNLRIAALLGFYKYSKLVEKTKNSKMISCFTNISPSKL